MDSNSSEEHHYVGIAASPGIAHGSVSLIREKAIFVPKYKVDEEQMKGEVSRFENALVETRKQIQDIQEAIRESLGEDEARIFDAHLLVLEDNALIDESIREMKATHENIEASVWAVGNRFIEALAKIDDEYLRERASDIRDVLRRLLSNLTGQSLEGVEGPDEKHVLVAHDIAPSDSASVNKEHLLGLVTDAGSKTSHTVIVARSMNIPAVVGLGDITQKVLPEDVVLVDGYEGRVIVNPSADTLFKYGKLKDERTSIEERMLVLSKEASLTQDGYQVQLMANIESAAEAKKAVELGADGVGLFRTEFLFMNVHSLPTEEEHFQAYRDSVEAMDGAPVVIRTLDLGGDKMPSSSEYDMVEESNPFLGYRAIRYCLGHTDVFLTQLRGLLRASAYGDVRIMYPMISGAFELEQANDLLEQAKAELREEGIPFNEGITSGAMIEIPSAAIACDTLVEGSSFFSIGTNDLIQYMMAVDRLNDRVAHLYEPTHPAVLRTLDMIVKAAKSGDLGVSVCGEMAGDPVMVPLLVGLGIDTLSVTVGALPNVKYVVQNMRIEEARELAKEALSEPDGSKTYERLLEFYNSRMAEFY
ncbi:MAG: phosphoenolpyruvate--protein phosphotransferase [Opitutaceae bacterium]|nr:phosphoenolpyruvate--protein phosphotransferase [Opitutaceae bacterium]